MMSAYYDSDEDVGTMAKRARRGQVDDDPIVVNSDEKFHLHRDGFVVINNIFESSETLVSALHAQRVGTEVEEVFNYNDRSDQPNDGKRHQVPLRKTRKCIKDAFNKIVDCLQTKYPQHTVCDCNIIFSDAGCRIQAAHCDYSIDSSFAQLCDEDVPLGCLVAVEICKLYVWRGSHRLSGLKEELLKGVKEIKPTVIYLRPGDGIVFRGDTIHAGAEYKERNVRLHVYIDSPAVNREKNSTFLQRPEGDMSWTEMDRIIQ